MKKHERNRFCRVFQIRLKILKGYRTIWVLNGFFIRKMCFCGNGVHQKCDREMQSKMIRQVFSKRRDLLCHAFQRTENSKRDELNDAINMLSRKQAIKCTKKPTSTMSRTIRHAASRTEASRGPAAAKHDPATDPIVLLYIFNSLSLNSISSQRPKILHKAGSPRQSSNLLFSSKHKSPILYSHLRTTYHCSHINTQNNHLIPRDNVMSYTTSVEDYRGDSCINRK